MQTFLAVFTGSATSQNRTQWDAMDATQRREREAAGMKAWGEWMTKHHSAVVVSGGPLGKTKCISSQGIKDVRNNLAGFVVVKAETHEAAAAMFIAHPHFTLFPGDGVEVMPVLAIPGQ